MADKETRRYGDGRRSSQGDGASRYEDVPHQGRLSAHDNFERYHSQRPRRTQGRVRAAYQQTRVDVEAHKHLHSDARHRAGASAYDARARDGRDARQNRPRRSSSGGNHSVKRGGGAPRGGIPRKLIAAVAAVIVVVVAVLVFHPFGIGAPSPQASQDPTNMPANSPTTEDQFLPTPIMAESGGVQLHSAVAMNTLTEVLIHNASYSYAMPLETKLVEGTNVDIMAAHGTGRVASEQPTGDEWMTGEFIRTYRQGNGGPKMSAIDCGAAPGTQVYSPVTGTVQLVRAYKLYGEEDYDDYEIHIQPDGHPELDVVLIHLTDPQVQRGDVVEGGVTPIAKIRDVYAYIGESMQLKKYTAEGDNGNHTHIQVNNAKHKDYHGLDADRIAKSVPLQISE